MGRKRITSEDFSGESMGVNPLSLGLTIWVYDFRKDHNLIEISEDEELDSGVMHNFKTRNILETSRFVKVFESSENRKLLCRLSPRAKGIFLWIIMKIKPGEDFIVMNVKMYLKENEVSFNTYKGGIEDLVMAGVISYSRYSNVYWINPAILFKGNRLKKYPDAIEIFKRVEK